MHYLHWRKAILIPPMAINKRPLLCSVSDNWSLRVNYNVLGPRLHNCHQLPHFSSYLTFLLVGMLLLQRHALNASKIHHPSAMGHGFCSHTEC